MPRLTIKNQLEKSLVNNSVLITDASNEASYIPLDTTNYFIVGADIDLKNHAFYNDEEGSNKPVVHAAPLNAPANPAINSTLEEIFDDYFVFWKWNGATWAKLTEQDRYEHCQLSYYDNGLGATPHTGFIVPAYMNGWVCKIGCAQNDTNSFAIPVQVFRKNGAVFGPGFTQGAGGTTCVNFAGGVTVATGDLITINAAAFPAAPVNVYGTITLQRP